MLQISEPPQSLPVMPCRNEKFRKAAHEQLDAILDQVDSVRGAFGEVGVKVGHANGQFSAVKTFRELNHKIQS